MYQKLVCIFLANLLLKHHEKNMYTSGYASFLLDRNGDGRQFRVLPER